MNIAAGRVHDILGLKGGRRDALGLAAAVEKGLPRSIFSIPRMPSSLGAHLWKAPEVNWVPVP